MGRGWSGLGRVHGERGVGEIRGRYGAYMAREVTGRSGGGQGEIRGRSYMAREVAVDLVIDEEVDLG